MSTDGLPAWWVENQRIKADLDLPEYEPPRFVDGTYVHEVVASLEEELGCEVLFIGIEVRYLDDWEVRVDGETAFEIEKRRDREGNTVWGMGSEEFEEAVRKVVSMGRDGNSR